MISRPRVIPVLLIEDGGLVKTVRFKSRTYLGDPINTVRLFNDMEVDELVVLDIGATRAGRGPDYDLIRLFTNECFMPLCYGGGIVTVEQIQRLFGLGVEKVAINSAARRDPELVRQAAATFGSQSIVASLDVRRTLLGRYEVYDYATGKRSGDAMEMLKGLVDAGAGEVLLTAVDRDGTMQGYDLALTALMCRTVTVPVIVCGGAGRLQDCVEAVRAGAHAAAAGSMFVFQGRERGVLINYPDQKELDRSFSSLSMEKGK
jgi:cyclase